MYVGILHHFRDIGLPQHKDFGVALRRLAILLVDVLDNHIVAKRRAAECSPFAEKARTIPARENRICRFRRRSGTAGYCDANSGSRVGCQDRSIMGMRDMRHNNLASTLSSGARLCSSALIIARPL